MSQPAVYAISSNANRLEDAFSNMYREAQSEVRRARFAHWRLDAFLTVCNAGAWLYTIAALTRHM